ncbi:MAG TPA: SCO family protein, partial [Bacteroidia bacterium]|nr:SCO family protein [Bacteroidia bacterium]
MTLTLGLLWTSCNEDRPLRTLPVYGMQDEQNKSNHTIGSFSFIDQNGDTVTDKDYSNKIYVTDFFFTTCRSICPVMTTQMQRVFEHYKSNPDVMFLSYSVNPEYDTPAVLKEYADKHHADAKKWHFVTGN